MIKKQTNPEIKMRENCAFPQQIVQFGSGTVASNMPNGKVLLCLSGNLLSVLNRLFSSQA